MSFYKDFNRFLLIFSVIFSTQIFSFFLEIRPKIKTVQTSNFDCEYFHFY